MPDADVTFPAIRPLFVTVVSALLTPMWPTIEPVL